MNEVLNEIIELLPIDELMDTPAGAQLKAAARLFESVQKHVYSLLEKQGEEGQTALKTGTVLTVGILKRLYSGKKLKEFTREDWKAICKEVDEDALLANDQQYTRYVFDLYAKYIRFSVSMIRTVEGMSQRTTDEIAGLADELDRKKQLLGKDNITEAAYIEDCLWISLEAMIKLLASTAVLSRHRFGEEYPELAQAVASCAFEYGRYALYSREQEILTEYLESQKALDKELAQKYADYLDAMKKETERFYLLVDHAFDPDFRETFLQSIALAKAVGVREENILQTEAEIDDFFLQ